MAFFMPEGVEVNLDAAFPDDTSSNDSGSSISSETSNRDFHQEAFPAYVAPNRRGHNVQPGDEFVNFKARDPKKGPDPDKVMGADNDKYQRLKIRTNFALAKKDKDCLVPDFPGIYFHSGDNTNHDHPKSHVVTQIGTRFLQRKIAPGSSILDVYGNPNACERFETSQKEAVNPKKMHALVYNFGHTDFIREVNKCGPIHGPDGTRYIYSKLKSITEDGTIAKYNVLQLIHTLYYLDLHELNEALHAPCDGGTRTAVALVHKHEGNKGFLNYGEQSYEKKRGLVKQINVNTNSSYVHPDLTPMLFAEKKYWYPSESTLYSDARFGKHNPRKGLKGFTWDLNMVNSDTWIVQIVPCTRPDDQGDGYPDDEVDYEELWDEYEEQDLIDPVQVTTPGPRIEDRKMILPMPDGKFIELDLCSERLLSELRVSCVGKKRDAKLISELVNQARHLINPSTLFGSVAGMPCPEDKIYDHVIGAIFSDLCRETSVLQAASLVGPLIEQHTRALSVGNSFLGFKYDDFLSVLRKSVGLAKKVNSVMSAKDLVEAGLTALDDSMK